MNPRRGVCAFVAVLVWLPFAAACAGGGQGEGDVEAPPACDPDDPDPRGPACATRVESDAAFDRLSIGPTGVPTWERATKYMVPATDDPAAIPPLVQNANRYQVHRDFLAALFFPGLDLGAYAQLVTLRDTRQYFAGNLIRIDDPVLGRFYGFTVYAAAKPSELLEPAEVKRVYDQLGGVVTAGPLAYTFEPYDAMGPARARAWIEPGFPVAFPNDDGVKVEVYTPGTAFGRVRRLTLEQLEPVALAGTLGFRDLLVLDSVPFDVESVVAGLVTGGRQWELSHVNVRLGARGTPNLFVADALAAFAPFEGQLVRLDAAKKPGAIGADTYTIAAATEADAEAWWAALRPRLDDVPVVDRAYRTFDGLTSMDVDDAPVRLVARFGGKAANLAKLYAFLEPGYQVPGFGVPFAFFEDFLDQTTVVDPRDESATPVPLRELVRRLASDPAVSSDAALRRDLLAALRAQILTGGAVPPVLVEALATRIAEVFGSTGARVRFRSSSNVEDSLEFPGAGLYDSTTVCADDSLDDDARGPSACDPTENGERDIARGLRRVWASLYNDRAWAERDWYQVPQDAAGMAVLVTLGFPDEAANGVIFTGDPADPTEARYLVNAQLGDEPVVSNDPSKVPEADRLEITDGQVTWVYRVRSSSLATPGVPVLSDEQLVELGGVLASIDAAFPVDLGEHARSQVLLDVEFKVEKVTGHLKLKQVRPFLRPSTAP